MKQQELEDRYNKLIVRGNGMVHLPNSNVKLILPNFLIGILVNHAVMVESLPNQQEVIVPIDGQLNISYFTGDNSNETN